MNKNLKLVVVLLGLFFLSNLELIAAGPPGPPGGGGGGPPGGCWPPSTCIPIDGGLSFLLLAGAAYGAKKIHDISKKEKAE